VPEKDGLALSSRNVYLSSAERFVVPMLYGTHKESAVGIARTSRSPRGNE
jgi:pantothenate synthetase